MSTQSALLPPWNRWKTSWYILLMLATSLLLQLPLYYYFYNLSPFSEKQYYWILVTTPIMSAFVLVRVFQNLVEYFWRRERIEKNRNMAIKTVQSLVLGSILYILVFYAFTLHFLNNVGLSRLYPYSPGTLFMVELLTSLLLLLFISQLMAVPRETK